MGVNGLIMSHNDDDNNNNNNNNINLQLELHSLTSQPHYKTHAHQFLGICQPVVRPVNL